MAYMINHSIDGAEQACVDYHGSHDLLEHIPYDDIAKYALGNSAVLDRIIKALGEQYGVE